MRRLRKKIRTTSPHHQTVELEQYGCGLNTLKAESLSVFAQMFTRSYEKKDRMLINEFYP